MRDGIFRDFLKQGGLRMWFIGWVVSRLFYVMVRLFGEENWAREVDMREGKIADILGA